MVRGPLVALENFADPAASARLFAIASGRDDPLVPLTMDILHEPPTPENAPLHSAAMDVLHYLDDPAILPFLAGLDFRSDDRRFIEFLVLRGNLSRERDGAAGAP